MRIHPIHEGTTGIQGMDMLGRKVVMKNEQAFQIYIEKINGFQPIAQKGTYRYSQYFR